MAADRLPPDSRPTHIIDTPGAKHTRCGKVALHRDGLPHVWAPFVQAHINGYGMTVCPDCAAGGWDA